MQNPSSGTILIYMPSFNQRLYYDPTLQLQHTVPVITESLPDITVELLKNKPEITLTPSVDLENVLEYYFNLISISEVSSGLNPTVLQSTSTFRGAWYQGNDLQSSYQGYALMPDAITEVSFALQTQLYQSGSTLTIGDDQFSLHQDSLSFGINVNSWPWVSQTSTLNLKFRITFYRFMTGNTNETEVWFHKVGSNKFLDYIHVEGGVHNNKLLHLRFPRAIFVDGVQARQLGLTNVVKVDPSTIDITFVFPHFNSTLQYNPIIYISTAAKEWILFLVVVVICCTLLLAGYAIVHKVRKYETMA